MIQSSEKCYGCGACATICPQNTIQLKLDDQGFFQVAVGNDCINCHLCEKVCPIDSLTHYQLNENTTRIVAKAKIKDEKSSSGGISYLLSKEALQDKLPVCGVTYDGIQDEAKHLMITSIKELPFLQGSKYLASDPVEGFKDILQSKKGVVFGTPCQIAGFHNVLTRMNLRDEYLLVDLFCHGVPSYLLWKKHQAIQNKGNEEVVFRKNGQYIIQTDHYLKEAQVEPFYYYYLRDLVNRESCYSCPYRRNSDADLRLGDYTVPGKKNLSVIMINTKKGEEWIQKIEDQLELFDSSWQIIEQNQVKGDIKIPEQRNQLLTAFQSCTSIQHVFGKKQMIIQIVKGMIKKIIRRKNA